MEIVMKGLGRKLRTCCFAAGAMLVGLLSISNMSYGQSLKEQIVGTWRLTSFYSEENGVKRDTFGDKPVGMLMIDGSGNIMTMQSRTGIPKFAIGNRTKGTDAENRAVLEAIIAGFGSYTVEGDTVTISWISSSYPNRIGTQEKRTYKITGDNLMVTNPGGSSGGTAVSAYTRVK